MKLKFGLIDQLDVQTCKRVENEKKLGIIIINFKNSILQFVETKHLQCLYKGGKNAKVNQRKY